MKIRLSSVLVDDQAKALAFYTDVLGFVKNQDMPIGEDRWLTVSAADGPQDIELLLEPNKFPPAKTYQEALFAAGIPMTAFSVEDVDAEYQRLSNLGVSFRSEPTEAGETSFALFEGGCGNLIQVFQE
jgi:catechol 2,3-dioxygenase-like lactoylglutathione lyase family enzyme